MELQLILTLTLYFLFLLQSDYLRKISFKILTLEAKFQNPMVNCLQSNAASSSKNPQVLGTENYVDIK